jgi:hypothetical protein
MRRRAWLALLAALLVAALGTSALGERKPADRVWTRAGLESRNIHCIAILPPVGEAREGTLSLEDRWFMRVYGDGHAWLPSAMVVDRLARNPRQGEALLERIRRRIESGGEVDSASATQVARAMGADAVLTLRLDRWERLGGGSKTVAYVEATCALQDSSGRLLLKITGAESVTGFYGVPTGKVGNVLPPSHDDRLAGPMMVLASFTPGGRGAALAVAQGGNTSRLCYAADSPRPGTTPQSGNLPQPGTNPQIQNQYAPPEDHSSSRMRLEPRQLNGGTTPFEGRLAPDFDLALARLLDRWVALFPKARKPSVATRSS